MFSAFQNTNAKIKTVARHSNATGSGFPFMGLPSTIKLGHDGGVPENGLVARFRADTNVTLNGSTVASWSDLNNVYTLSQATTANQPAFVSAGNAAFFNNRPCIAFNGTAKSLAITNNFGIGTQGVWGVFGILYNTAAINTTGYLIYFTAGLNGGYTLYDYDGSFGVYCDYWNPPAATQKIITQAYVQNTVHLLGVEINRTNSTAYSYYNTGAYSSASILSTLTDYSTGTFVIGGSTAGWYLAELLIYNQSLALASLGEQRQLYYYLKNVYGIN